jgi:hypothetical protein
LSCFIH